ncbi:hypothetical protein ILYODFUR_032150 [Ilyodon furcidens]|uniref:Uncharacterized protein n=1 Tax=Ilyodon furcidens TaxID=33524 RepID=A0ABV0UL26_9TELE
MFFVKSRGNFNLSGNETLSPHLLRILAELCCHLPPPVRRRCHRCQGKQDSCLVKFKTSFNQSSKFSHRKCELVPSLVIHHHSLDPVWLVAVVGAFWSSGNCSPHLHCRSLNFCYLQRVRLLGQTTQYRRLWPG